MIVVKAVVWILQQNVEIILACKNKKASPDIKRLRNFKFKY